MVKCLIFDKSEAKPSETLNVSVPKLTEHGVTVPGSLALSNGMDLSAGCANNSLVQNVSRTASCEVWGPCPARH